MDEIEAHPGTRAHRAWEQLSQVHQILQRNEAELIGLIKHVENNLDLALDIIQNVRPNPTRQPFFVELVRLLHNYSAAVMTLVDHTRNLMQSYEGTATGEEYARRVAEIRASGVAKVVQNLRQHLLHYAVPPVGVSVHVDNVTAIESQTCFLDRRSSLTWDKWSAVARRYLEDHPDDQINLRDLIQHYADGIEDLYRWLYAQFEVLHGDEIEAVNELIKRMPTALRPDGSPPYDAPQEGDDGRTSDRPLWELRHWSSDRHGGTRLRPQLFDEISTPMSE